MDEEEWRRRAPQVRQRIEEIKRAMAWRPAWTERQESRARDSRQTSTWRYSGGLVEEEVGFTSPFDGSKLMERSLPHAASPLSPFRPSSQPPVLILSTRQARNRLNAQTLGGTDG
jgi:hypothetical protein